MRPKLIVMTGTGTEIGKTHLSCALLARWGRSGVRCCGLKPVETGVTGGDGPDARTLAEASTFHVKPGTAPYNFKRPVSPHLAAREEGVTIDVSAAARWCIETAAAAEGALVELPGGLFSPLAMGVVNADLARALAPDAIILAAPDRLGVLHDVGAAERAAKSVGLEISAIAVIAPAEPDAATGLNVREMAAVASARAFGAIPRASWVNLADDPHVAALLAYVTRRDH
jgi:dethiobiotin synthetase